MLKSHDSQLKILINEWSEIFDSNWALKPQNKKGIEIFKTSLIRNIQSKVKP